MGKYAPLGDFLRAQSRNEVPLTFAEIERITGVKLPVSALRHRPWWSNNAANSVMTKVWLEAGFETAQVDMERRQLVFRRVGKPHERPPPSTPSAMSPRNPDTGRHPLLGHLKGLVRIMPGTDLTQPADPHWGDVWDEK
jgi:hypothetical protein